MVPKRLDDLKQRIPSEHYYSEPYRIAVESCMELIRNSANTRVINVDAYQARIYEHQLFKFLLEVGIPYEVHWVVMRVNAMHSQTDFTRDTKTLIVPDQSFLANLKISLVTANTIEDY